MSCPIASKAHSHTRGDLLTHKNSEIPRGFIRSAQQASGPTVLALRERFLSGTESFIHFAQGVPFRSAGVIDEFKSQ